MDVILEKIVWRRPLTWVGSYLNHCFEINAHTFIFQIGYPTVWHVESKLVRWLSMLIIRDSSNDISAQAVVVIPEVPYACAIFGGKI